MSTKDRPSLTVFADDGIAAMVHELHRRGGATAALIYTYVGRCAPQTHRCGLFQLHLDFLARDVGISREKLDELCPALHPHASFDPDTHVWWVPDLAEQYFPHAEADRLMHQLDPLHAEQGDERTTSHDGFLINLGAMLLQVPMGAPLVPPHHLRRPLHP